MLLGVMRERMYMRILAEKAERVGMLLGIMGESAYMKIPAGKVGRRIHRGFQRIILSQELGQRRALLKVRGQYLCPL